MAGICLTSMQKRIVIVVLVVLATVRMQPLAAQNTQASVRITAPAEGARVAGKVTVTATAPGGTVVLRVDGTVVGQDASAPYTFSWDTSQVAVGRHQLRAEVSSSTAIAGGVSSTVTVTVERPSASDPPPAAAKPTVNITSPADQAAVTGTVTITATASNAVTSVTFHVDGKIIGTDTSAPFRQNWDTRTVQAGPHTLLAEGRDAAGNVGTSPKISVVVNKTENRLPTATMTAPAGGTTHRAPATITLAATATDPDGSVSRVEFYEQSTLLGVDTTEPFTFTWAARAAGTYRFSAHAVDDVGGVAKSAAVQVTVVADETKSSKAVFEPSANDGAVVRYVLDVFRSGMDPEASPPSASQSLGKPPIVNGECSADISETLGRLAPGTYVATVSAVGSTDTARSAPSAPFVIEAGRLSTRIGLTADDAFESPSSERQPSPAPSSAIASGLLWVTNSSTNMVTAFDAATGDVLATIPVGLMPTGIAAPAGVDKVYVADEGSDSISVISKATFSVTATISLPSPAGRRPHHVAASADGRFVYVGERGANVVDVVDTANDVVSARFGAGWPGSTIRGIVADQRGDVVYAVSAGATPSMSTLVALNARTGGWLWHLPINGDANDFVIAPDGRTGIVARSDVGTLALIDLEHRSVVDELDLAGNIASDLQFSADSRFLVIALQQTSERVGIVDLTRAEGLRTIAIGAVPAPTSLSAAQRSYVCVADGIGVSAGIIAIDAHSQAFVGRFRFPGGGSPHSAVFDSD
jgi:YVTN family beta-propeller protein